MLKRVLAALMAVAMTFTAIPASSMTVQAAAAEGEYEIYPTPHSVAYKEGTFEIGTEVNIVFENGLDEVTENKLIDGLEAEGIHPDPTRKLTEDKTNILVGIRDSGEYVDSYAKEALGKEDEIEANFAENHYDAYVLDIQEGVITILGDTTDGAFYGIVSLLHILDQVEDGRIRNLTILDYADTAIRGFIEGYYGLPWSDEDRMSLMEFGGQFKMTCYIFAPKDDPYHRNKWREEYPAEELAAIEKMVNVGNENKCRFVWTAHPFLAGDFNSSDVQGEIEKLLAKFDQLYSVGVRQFGVLADDAGSISYDILISIMQAVSAWAEEKGDVYDSVFCPAGYNHSWQKNYNELNALDAAFPDDVQIFWTGEAVCQPVETTTLDHFRNNNVNEEGKTQRRAPLFWLNWPVNDINSARMLLGKGSLLHTDVDPADLAGVVTNPMQEAESSKNALFAVADYAWNIRDFNADQSWEDGFAYIDAEASEELYTIAKHMSDPSPNSHGLNLEESADLQPMLEAYKAKLAAGTLTKEDHQALIEEFEIISDACDNFHEKSQNENLKDELKPFTDSLKDQAEAAIGLIRARQAVEEGNETEAWSFYSQATADLAASKTYKKPALINNAEGKTTVAPSAKHITPFVESLSAELSPVINSMIDDSKVITTYITNRTDSPASGSVDNIFDGDVESGAIYKTPNKIAAGDYVGVKFSRSIAVNDIRFVLGTGKDHFDHGKLQYTEDGTTWEDLTLTGMENLFTGVQGQVQDVQIAKSNLPADLKAMGIRFITTKGNTSDAWLEVREIVINDSNCRETIFVPEGFEVYQGRVSDITDENDDTFIWYRTPNNTVTEGQYVGIDLGGSKEIGRIRFVMMEDDRLSDYTLQYSEDGTHYTDIGHFTDRIAEVDLSEQQITARYIRVYNNANTGCWLKVATLSVSEVKSAGSEIFTNKDTVTDYTSTITKDTAVLAGTSAVSLKTGEYVGLALERIKDITEITYSGEGTENLTLETSKNNVVWTAVETGARAIEKTYEDARYIRLINRTEETVSATVTDLTVKSKEVQAISVLGTNFGGTDTHLKAFDHDRTTKAELQADQNEGQYIIYDLGQEISLSSLKMVLSDSEWDYPRHGKVSVSTDNKTWTEIMTIGNQEENNPGEAENTDTITDYFPNHEISYNTKEATGLSVQARYLKYENTRAKAGDAKWVKICEIELNGGDMFLPESNDPTILTTAQESDGNIKLNMIDGDLSTTFQPEGEKEGSFTYYLSEKTDVKRINIMQSPNTLSNAAVTAEVMAGTEKKTVTLGKLAESFNKFNTSAYDHVLSVTVTWEAGNVPCIQEIITLNTVDDGENKKDLYDLYNGVQSLEKENYTIASWEALQQAAKNANAVLLDGNAAAQKIAEAKAALTEAKNNLISTTALQRLKELAAKELMEADYTKESWALYSQKKAEAQAFLNTERTDNEEINKMLRELEAAYDALYTLAAAAEENLQLTITFAAQKIEEEFTPTTWKVFREAYTAAMDLLNRAEKTAEQLTQANTALESAMDNLVKRADKTDLKNVLEGAPSEEAKEEYTAASWKSYEAAKAEAEKLMKDADASQEAVTAAKTALESAQSALVPATGRSRLQELCEEQTALGLNREDYTEASWAAYAKAKAAAEALWQTSAEETAYQAAAEELRTAYAELETTRQGSIRQLKAKIAEERSEDAYTPVTWAAYEDALEEAKFMVKYARLKNKSQIDGALAELTAQAKALTARADLTKLTEQIGAVPSAGQKEDYTAASWAVLEAKLQAANSMKDNLNATQEQVDQAAQELQTALGALAKRGDKSGLTAALEKLKKQKETDYTRESWAALQEKVTAAKKVLEQDADVKTVNDAKAALEEAVKALVKIEDPDQDSKDDKSENTGNDSKDDKSENTGTDSKNDKNENTGTDSKDDKEKDQNTGSGTAANTAGGQNGSQGTRTETTGGANTGDSAKIALWTLLLAASALALVMKKRKISG